MHLLKTKSKQGNRIEWVSKDNKYSAFIDSYPTINDKYVPGFVLISCVPKVNAP